MATREAGAAGSFYPGQKEKLRQQLEQLFKGLPKEEKTECVIAPHAGYPYSGKTAAYSFNALQENKCFVILSPSHTGLGPEISVSDADEWATPIGSAPIDAKLRQRLLERLEIQADDLAHIEEHSIEVQLPFLQFLFKGGRILPITIAEHGLERLKELGKALSEIGGKFSVIASGDFTHHQQLQIAREKDFGAIKKIEAVDVEGFYNEVVDKQLSICGLSPITALMQYCKEKGFKRGKLLHYDTSASASGDEASVVGYAAIGFY